MRAAEAGPRGRRLRVLHSCTPCPPPSTSPSPHAQSAFWRTSKDPTKVVALGIVPGAQVDEVFDVSPANGTDSVSPGVLAGARLCRSAHARLAPRAAALVRQRCAGALAHR